MGNNRGKLVLIEQPALDVLNAVVQEARFHIVVSIRLEAARRACRIQLLDRRYEPENIIKARRN